MSTTKLVGLLIVHGRTRCPSRGWYAEERHDKGERAVGFMVSITTGTGRGGKGAEAQKFPGLTGLVGGKTSANVLDCLYPGMVLTVCE